MANVSSALLSKICRLGLHYAVGDGKDSARYGLTIWVLE